MEEEVEADAGFGDLEKRFRRLHEAGFFEEVDQFRGDPVGFETAPLDEGCEMLGFALRERGGWAGRRDRGCEGTYTHDEEDAGEEGAGDQVQHH